MMASRASTRSISLRKTENDVSGKVVAKVTQGPVLQRAALGEIGNRKLARVNSAPVAKKKEELKGYGLRLQKEKIPVKSTKQIVKQGQNDEGQKKLPAVTECMDAEETKLVSVESKGEGSKIEELSQAFSNYLLNVEDIDAHDSENPQLVSAYVNDIYKYLWSLEDEDRVEPLYLQGQELTGKMRAILIDWLVQVHTRFTLIQETLYLCVAIIDRYLQKERKTPRNKFQLVGVTALFIASKYEEMYCPEIEDFSFITDKTFTNAEIRKMEVKILNTINFNVSFPLPLHFLRRNSKAGSVDGTQHALAKYLMELSLVEYNMCHYKPSLIAAAALCFSLRLLDHGSTWNDTLVYYSQYKEKELEPVISKMAAVVLKLKTSKQQAVKNKYKSPKLMKISAIPELESDLVVKLAGVAQ